MPRQKTPSTEPETQFQHASTRKTETTPEMESVTVAQRAVTKPPSMLTPADILGLQRTIGNRAISRMIAAEDPLSPPQLQPVRPEANKDEWLKNQQGKDKKESAKNNSYKVRSRSQLEIEWKRYKEKYDKRTQRVNNMPDANLKVGDYLYHETTKDAAKSIRDKGLLPRQLTWASPEASKDGYLSMSTTYIGASAMGGSGRNVKLLVKLLKEDLEAGMWKRVREGGTEVLTTIGFTPYHLDWQWSDSKDGKWHPMSEYTGE